MAGMELARAYIVVRAEQQELRRDLEQVKMNVSQSLGSLAGRIGGLFSAIGVGVGIGYLLNQFKAMVETADAVERSMEKMQIVFESVGETIGVTAEDVKAWSSELSRGTAASGSSIRSAAMSLSNFDEIQGPMFRRALSLAVDMSASYGSVESNAYALGRALQSPEHGMMALRRAHITLSDEQKQYIKLAAAQGNEDRARLIMLEAIEAKKGGQARKYAESGPGMKEQLGKELKAVQIEMGKLWDEANKSMIRFKRDFFIVIVEAGRWVQAIVSGIKDLVNINEAWGRAIRYVAIGVGIAATAFTVLTVAIKAAAVAKTLLVALEGPAGVAFVTAAVAASAGVAIALGNAGEAVEKKVKEGKARLEAEAGKKSKAGKEAEESEGGKLDLAKSWKQLESWKDELWDLDRATTDTDKKLREFKKHASAEQITEAKGVLEAIEAFNLWKGTFAPIEDEMDALAGKYGEVDKAVQQFVRSKYGLSMKDVGLLKDTTDLDNYREAMQRLTDSRLMAGPVKDMERELFGLTERYTGVEKAVEEFKVKNSNAGREVVNRFREMKIALEEFGRSEEIRTMGLDIRTMAYGMTSAEAEVEKMRDGLEQLWDRVEKGPAEGRVKRVEEARRQEAYVMSKSKALYTKENMEYSRSMMTPLEQYREQMAQISRMEDRGLDKVSAKRGRLKAWQGMWGGGTTSGFADMGRQVQEFILKNAPGGEMAVQKQIAGFAERGVVAQEGILAEVRKPGKGGLL